MPFINKNEAKKGRETGKKTTNEQICLREDRSTDPGGGGNSHMKQTGMLVGNFEFNPYRRPIWAWLKQILTPKRDRLQTQK